MEQHAERVLGTAKLGYDRGLNMIPAKDDGSKRPDGSWREQAEQRPSLAATERAHKGKHGLGILFGKVWEPNGDLARYEVGLFEFDDAATYDAFLAAAQHDPVVGPVVQRMRTGYEERTPSGGIHLVFYCPEIETNSKLAQRPKRDDERRRLPDGTLDPDDTVKTTIETRERGGFGIVAPSAVYTHPSRKPYVLLRGGLGEIATITSGERKTLYALARTFDDVPRQSRQQRRANERREEKQGRSSQRSQAGTKAGTSTRPGDDFTRRSTWTEVLGPHGWEEVRTDDAGMSYWRRPGAATDGHDATTNADGDDGLYVHSTSASPLEANRYYDKFSAYAVLNHGGDFTAAAKALRSQGYGGGTAGETRVTIDAADGHLNHLGDQLLAALVNANTPPRIYVGPTDGISRIERDVAGRAVVRELDDHPLRYEANRVAKFTKATDAGPVEVAIPLDVVRNARARPDHPFPPLVQIVTYPIFGDRSPGSLRTDSGYVPEAWTYVDLGPLVLGREVVRAPGVDEVAAARDLLLGELFGDFPFVGDADRAHALAMALLPFGRALIAGPTPLHVVEAATPGSGKSLLVQVATSLAVGPGGAPSTPEAEDDAEWRKRITSSAIAGQPFLVIGNLRAALDSPSLAEALTTSAWTDRLLGTNRTVRAGIRFVWAVTANNPVLSDELARRAIRIRLDPKVDQPHQRTGFRHALPAWSDAHRDRLVHAALTLWSAWLVAGCPAGKPTLGSFEAWATTMGGLLDVAGVSGFLDNANEFYAAADAEGAKWRALVAAWLAAYGTEPVIVADLFGLPVVADAFEFHARTSDAMRKELGKALAKQRDRWYGDLMIGDAGTDRRGIRRYVLVHCDGQPRAGDPEARPQQANPYASGPYGASTVGTVG